MKILAVCLGNICRSPLAEGLLASKLGDDFIVDSAGVIALHQGSPPDHRAVKVASKYGIDISEQVSRPLNSSDFDLFDKIYCMDKSVHHAVLAKAGSEAHRNKVILFLNEAYENAGNEDVPDPYYGEMEDFEHVFQLLDKSTDLLVQRLNPDKQ